MTIHKALHPTDHVDRLYVSRKEGGRDLANSQDIFDSTTRRLHKNAGKDWLQRPETIPIAQASRERKYKKKSEVKQLYGHLMQQISKISHKKKVAKKGKH